MSALTAIKAPRRMATPQAVSLIVDMLAALHLDAIQAADVVEATAEALKGSAYSEYGSVDLSDVFETIRGEHDAFTLPSTCMSCSGSGEGRQAGNCWQCAGRGEIAARAEVMAR